MDLAELSTVQSEGDTSKKAKRRSLLPQFSRKPSGEEQVTAGIQEENEDDMAGNSRAGSERTRESVESLGRNAVDEDRKAMPPPSKLSRPASMIPPRGASERVKTGTREAPKYKEESRDMDADTARAQSLAALTGTAPTPAPASPTLSKLAKPSSGLQRSGSTRLPQSPKVGGPAIPSRTTSDISRTRRTSNTKDITSSTSVAEKRSSFVKARPLSQTNDSATHDTEPTSPRNPSMMSRPRPSSQMPSQQASPPRAPTASRPLSQIMAPPARPAFSTYQQHYSPAKSALPKAPIPAARTSSAKLLASADEDISMSLDVAMQQIELLQLTLLHQASTKCMHEYTASAKRKLAKKHTKLRKDYESIRATELVYQRVANLSALEAWCQDPGMLVENLQILSLVYSDLTSLIEEGSRHGDVISMFELWMHEAEAPEPGSFIQPLPDDWKAAHASLALKLRSIQRNLGVLPPPRQHQGGITGLEVVLKGCKTLVDGMIKELEVMFKLEKELLAREKSKIEEDVKALVLDDVGMQPWVPAWQKVG